MDRTKLIETTIKYDECFSVDNHDLYYTIRSTLFFIDPGLHRVAERIKDCDEHQLQNFLCTFQIYVQSECREEYEFSKIWLAFTDYILGASELCNRAEKKTEICKLSGINLAIV